MKQISLSFLFGIFLFILQISCKTTYYSSPDEFDGKQIILTESGGFSGQTTKTFILENGQVFIKTNFPESLEESKRLSEKTTEIVFQRMETLQISQVSFMHPGNLTYSLMLKSKDQKYEIKWGDPGFTVPEEVSECYRFFHDQINLNN